MYRFREAWSPFLALVYVLQLVISTVPRNMQHSHIDLQLSFYVTVGGGTNQKLLEGPNSVNGPFGTQVNFTNILFLSE